MKLYNYDPITHEYTGTFDADESPLEPGVFLIPANSTEVKVPKLKGNQIAVFDGVWSIVDDLRGKIAYNKVDGSEVDIETLGTLDTLLTLDAKPSEFHYWVDGVWSLDQLKLKENIKEQIKSKRDELQENNGFKVGTNWFHSDQKSRTQYLGLLQMTAIPANLMWKTKDSAMVSVTSDLVKQILEAAILSDIAIFTQAEQYIADLALAPDATLFTWDIWPIGYVKV
jgi:hypothetical protein